MPATGPKSLRFARRGFTLVELLVALAVVALLIAILLPALAGAHRWTQQTKSLANLHSLGQTLEIYTQTHRDYPFGTDGYTRPPEMGDEPIVLVFSIWLLDRHWPVLFHDVAPWREHYTTWLSPGADPARFSDLWIGDDSPLVSTTGLPSYYYSTSFVARPSLWDGQGKADPALVGAIGPADVLFPSAKVIMYDQERAYLGWTRAGEPARPVLMADGSAAARRDSQAAAPVQNPLCERAPTRYQDTPLGVHGRDF